MFSKTCEYGIKACIFIAINSYEDRRVTPKNISEEINSPQAFTAKILQNLVKAGLVQSTKGAYGGFNIEKNTIAKIKLSEIVNAIDGDAIYNGCGLGLETCDENHPCPVHDKFIAVRNGLKTMLEDTTLEELATNIKAGHSFLKV